MLKGLSKKTEPESRAMVGTFKTVKSAACVAIAVLVVSGTVAAQSADMTAALRLGRAMAKDTAEINRQEKACRDAVYASAEFAPIRKHGLVKPYGKQFSDNSMATEAEIILLSQGFPKWKSCFQLTINGYSRSAPTIVPILTRNLSNADDNFRDLILKKQSWGTFFKRSYDLGIENDNEINAEGDRIRAELAKAHGAELAERKARDEIELQLSNGGKTLSVPVIINNTLNVSFVLDTGATAVQIPAEMILELMRTGALSENDFIGTVTYFLADGSARLARQFLIREIQVGKHIVRNVTGIEGEPGADGLLGQSFLSKLPSWTLDNKRHVLVMAR
jgi:predicted aspartyl protease